MQVFSYPDVSGADGALLTLLVGSHGQSVSLPLFPSSSPHLSYPSHLCLSEGVLSRNKDTVPTLAASRGDQSCPQVTHYVASGTYGAKQISAPAY